MDQALLMCPQCKRSNEAGARFCRGCGRLLVGPDLEVSAAMQAPRYAGQDDAGQASAPEHPDHLESADQAAQPDAASARLLIRRLPTEADDGAASAPRIGEYALAGQTITIGRTQDCAIVLDGDTQTSRRHATLRCENNQYSVADLGSSNGTFVNDLEISAPTPLQHGDRILIGQHELLFLLDQPQVIAPQSDPTPQPADESADDAPDATPDALASQAADVQRARATSAPVAGGASVPESAPAGATAKYASVARLSTELAASASRMVAPQQNIAELDAIRAQLAEASEALTRQVGLQAALADRRRAALVETRERLADLIADLRGDDTEQGSPVHHDQQIGLQELVESVAADPNNLERLRALAHRADELAQALRSQGPSEGQWSYERAHTLRSLEDMLHRLRELA